MLRLLCCLGLHHYQTDVIAHADCGITLLACTRCSRLR